MFKFLDIFKTKTEPDLKHVHNDNILARVSYLIKKDKNGGLIDIEMQDYDNESVEALCKILNILGNEAFFVETIDMIKASLIKDGQDDILIKILASVSQNIKDKLIHSRNYSKLDEPCIKPSDMF